LSDARPIERVLVRLTELSSVQPRRCGEGWMAICCGHAGGKEQTASLSVREGADGKVLLNCHAEGCSYAQIVAGLGMAEADLFPPKDKASGRVRSKPQTATSADPKVTLQSFAEFLKLPVRFLEEQGLENHPGGVSLPFRDQADLLLFRKIRKHLTDKKLKYRYETTGTVVVPYGLWRLPAVREAKNALVISEGETDCLTLWHHGIQALGMPGATTADKLEAEHLAGIGALYVLQEPGAAGEKFVVGVADRLAAIGWNGDAWQVRMTEEQKDPSEMHKADPKGFKARFWDLCQRSQKLDAPKIEDMFVTLEDAEEQPIEFLWWPYLIRGGLNIVMGAPGEGKGQTTMALAAAVTTGAPFPGSTESREPADVLIFSPEDNINRIIKRRFRLSGGDGRRAHVFNFEANDFNFEEEDRIRLEAAMDRFRPALVVFDPFAKFGENVNLNDAKEIGKMLRPMSAIFERRNVTGALVAHTKKGAVSRAIEGLSGSIQVSAIVRSIVGIYPDPKRKASHEVSHGLWTHVKHNYSPQGRSIRFTITNGEDNFSRFEWGGYADTSAQDIASAGSNGNGYHPRASADNGAATAAACEFLRDLFASAVVGGSEDGSLGAYDVQRLARETGISQATLHRARVKMGIDSKRIGFGSGSRILWYPTKPIDRIQEITDDIDSARIDDDDGGESEVPF